MLFHWYILCSPKINAGTQVEAIKNGLIDPNAPKRGRGRPSGSSNKISGHFKRNFIGPMPYGQKHPAIRKNTNPKTLWP